MTSDKFSYENTPLAMSVCAYCVHKQRGKVCKAFPEGIPDEILYMGNDHSAPVEGDNGIQFTPREGWYPPTPKETHVPRS